VEQLQGYEVAAGSWEESVFPARVSGYRAEWLDDLCLSGEVAWGRLAKLRIEGHRLRRSVAAISLARFQPAPTRAFLAFMDERRAELQAMAEGEPLG
jgi:ATP-dependent Lhr-like helicase